MAKKILVIEDRKAIVDLLRTHLGAEGFQVVAATTGEEGLRSLSRERPDLLILDLILPDIDGLEICRRIRRNPETAHLPILVLSGKGQVADRVTGLELGADDYVTKPFARAEIVARVRALLRRASPSAPPRVLREGSIELDLDRYTASVAGRPVSLTTKEFDLLQALLAASGRTLTRSHLSQTIWGYENRSAVESRTLDVHIMSLRKKLGGEAWRIHTIRNVGYRLVPSSEEDAR